MYPTTDDRRHVSFWSAVAEYEAMVRESIANQKKAVVSVAPDNASDKEASVVAGSGISSRSKSTTESDNAETAAICGSKTKAEGADELTSSKSSSETENADSLVKSNGADGDSSLVEDEHLGAMLRDMLVNTYLKRDVPEQVGALWFCLCAPNGCVCIYCDLYSCRRAGAMHQIITTS